MMSNVLYDAITKKCEVTLLSLVVDHELMNNEHAVFDVSHESKCSLAECVYVFVMKASIVQ